MKRRRKPAKPKMTKSRLAKILGVSRQRIVYHCGRGDAPPLDDEDAWQLHLAAHGRDGGLPADLRKQIAEEKLGLARANRAEAERRNSIAAGEYLPAAKVETAIATAVSLLFSGLELAFLDELPPSLKHLDAVQIQTRCRATIEALKDRMRARFDELITVEKERDAAAAKTTPAKTTPV